jgi:LuxR family maltose regulon positive regulatory protein
MAECCAVLLLTLRSDPPSSLTTLRARGQATESRVHQLRFTKSETATFLQQLGMPADEKTVRALLESVEDWVTGMRLAVLSSRHRDSEDLAPAHVKGGIPYLTEYLLTEVLEGQPPAIQDYLLGQFHRFYKLSTVVLSKKPQSSL